MTAWAKWIIALALAVGMASAPFAASRAEDAGGPVSFAGKRISLLIGFSAIGGIGYDTYGRLLARYLGRHLPGDPTVVPENKPGAGSMGLANYLYNVAAQGRHRNRTGRPRCCHGSDYQRQRHHGEVRRHQVQLDRQHEQRGRRLFRMEHGASPDLAAGPRRHAVDGRLDRRRRRSADFRRDDECHPEDQAKDHSGVSGNERNFAGHGEGRAGRGDWAIRGAPRGSAAGRRSRRAS